MIMNDVSTEETPVCYDREQIVYSIDLPCLLEASAGSGKTSVIVDRYLAILVRQIVFRGLSYTDAVRSVVAVTFTRKAADEMKDRIRGKISAVWDENNIRKTCEQLVRHGLAETPDPEKIRTLAASRNELADRISSASISTIDAFALSLLKSYPVEAGIDPFVTAEDESGVNRLSITTQDAFYRCLRDWIRSADPDLAFLIRSVGYTRARFLLEELFGSVSQTGREDYAKIAELSGWLKERPEGGLPDAVRCLTTIRDILSDALEKGLPVRSRPPVERVLKPLRLFLENPDWTGLFQGGFFYEGSVKDLVAKLAPAHEKMAGILNGILFAPLWRLALRLEDAVSRLREQRREITFAEMEIKCRTMLKNHPGIRAAIRDERAYFLVDEFQDTSSSQKELFDLILRDERGKLRVCPFFVGDPKQSIYGFRSADVGVFIRTRDEFAAAAAGGDVLMGRLNRNYRSVPSVVNAVNEIFPDVFGGPARQNGQPRGIDYFRQEPDEKRADGKGDGVYFVPSCGDKLDDIFAQESRTAAELIGRLVASGGYRPKDILVLVRNRTRSAILKKHFNDILDGRGIAYYHVDTENVLETPEIRDLIVYLRALDDPESDLKFLSLLKSPFFRKSDPELLSLRLDGGRLYDAMRARRSAEMEIFTGLLTLKDRVTIPDLAEEIVRRTGYSAFLHALPNRKESVTNLSVFLDFLRRIQSVEMFRLTDLVYYLQEYGAHLSKPQVVGEKSDVVRVMTLHSAKGLESPVVIYLATGAGGRAGNQLFRMDRTDPERPRLRLSLVPGLKTPDVQDPEIRDSEEPENAEEKRLAYVAFTRAREKFYYLGVNGEKPVKASDGWRAFVHSGKPWVRNRLEDASEWSAPAVPGITDHGPLRKKVLAVLDRLAEQEKRLVRFSLPGVVTVTQLLDMEFSAAAFRNRYVVRSFPVEEALNELADLSGELTERDVRADRGTFLHRVFQFAGPDTYPAYIKATIGLEQEEIRNARDSMERDAGKFFAGGFYREYFRDAEESRPEWEIHFPVLFRGRRVEIRGSIDRYLEQNGRKTVVDYKLRVGANRSRYERQLNYYAYFLGCLNHNVDRLFLYDIEQNLEIPVSVQLDGMQERILGLLEQMESVYGAHPAR